MVRLLGKSEENFSCPLFTNHLPKTIVARSWAESSLAGPFVARGFRRRLHQDDDGISPQNAPDAHHLDRLHRAEDPSCFPVPCPPASQPLFY